MPWMSLGHVKSRGKNSNADEANDPDVAALLAQAEAIKDNPDAYLPVEVEATRELLAA